MPFFCIEHNAIIIMLALYSMLHPTNLAQTHPITTLKGFSYLVERLSASQQMKKSSLLSEQSIYRDTQRGKTGRLYEQHNCYHIIPLHALLIQPRPQPFVTQFEGASISITCTWKITSTWCYQTPPLFLNQPPKSQIQQRRMQLYYTPLAVFELVPQAKAAKFSIASLTSLWHRVIIKIPQLYSLGHVLHHKGRFSKGFRYLNAKVSLNCWEKWWHSIGRTESQDESLSLACTKAHFWMGLQDQAERLTLQKPWHCTQTGIFYPVLC